MHHEHHWAQDRAKTPATVGREKLLEPMVCRDCHATGHQDHTRGVSSIEMRLSPDSPPMRPGRFQGFTVCPALLPAAGPQPGGLAQPGERRREGCHQGLLLPELPDYRRAEEKPGIPQRGGA